MPTRFASLPAPGTVRILSDLHLGHDRSLIRRAEELRPLLAGADEVIFNGDTLQERADVFRPRSLSLVEELQEVCREEGVRPGFLRGNHDPAAWPWEMVDLRGGLVTVTHGDVWLRLISPWSRAMPQYRSLLEAIYAEYPPVAELDLGQRFDLLQRCRMAMPPLESGLYSRSTGSRSALFLREMWPPRRPWEIFKAYAMLPGLALEFVRTFRPNSRVMVFGHTHRARIWRRGGRLLINTGAFVTFAQPLMVEIKDRSLRAWRLAFKQGAWHPEEPIVTEPLGDPVEAESAFPPAKPRATEVPPRA